MFNPSALNLAAVQNARNGIIPRHLIWVRAYDRTTFAVTGYGFWTGDETLDFTVLDGQTGNLVSRSYVGLGSELVLPIVPRVSDLTIQTLEISLPQTHPSVIEMVRTKTVRFAKFDWHICFLDLVSRRQIDNPEINFLGEIDGDPINTPAANDSGSVVLEVVSDAIRSLTRTNPAKSSYEFQNSRGQIYAEQSDEFNQYSNAFDNVQIPWGQDSA